MRPAQALGTGSQACGGRMHVTIRRIASTSAPDAACKPDDAASIGSASRRAPLPPATAALKRHEGRHTAAWLRGDRRRRLRTALERGFLWTTCQVAGPRRHPRPRAGDASGSSVRVLPCRGHGRDGGNDGCAHAGRRHRDAPQQRSAEIERTRQATLGRVESRTSRAAASFWSARTQPPRSMLRHRMIDARHSSMLRAIHAPIAPSSHARTSV